MHVYLLSNRLWWHVILGGGSINWTSGRLRIDNQLEKCSSRSKVQSIWTPASLVQITLPKEQCISYNVKSNPLYRSYTCCSALYAWVLITCRKSLQWNSSNKFQAFNLLLIPIKPIVLAKLFKTSLIPDEMKMLIESR